MELFIFRYTFFFLGIVLACQQFRVDFSMAKEQYFSSNIPMLKPRLNYFEIVYTFIFLKQILKISPILVPTLGTVPVPTILLD